MDLKFRKAVIVDGLMCTGKTQLLQALANLRPDFLMIPEIDPALKEFENSHLLDSLFYLCNDLRKFDIARSGNSISLMDRSFISTFAYFLSFNNPIQIERLYRLWWSVELPALYIYLRDTPEASFQRASECGRHVVGQWATLETVQAIAKQYENIYKFLRKRSISDDFVAIESNYANRNCNAVANQIMRRIGVL